ncbi:MAG: hypothetical protein BWZ08_01187 [candidate division BRC1 bacterium ADurb.BinA292]|nr:MAG: hypothetical protein BWZ08_01187 [candidate division BRC1 bacterium ADurb.BinA292]
MPPQIDRARRLDPHRDVQIDRFAHRLPVQIRLHRPIVRRLRERRDQLVFAGGVDRKRDAQPVARARLGPPQVRVAAPRVLPPQRQILEPREARPRARRQILRLDDPLDPEDLGHDVIIDPLFGGHGSVRIGPRRIQIPVADRRIHRRPAVRIILLDARLQLGLERNIIRNVPAVDRNVIPVLRLRHRLAVEGLRKQQRQPPRVAVVVLAAGAVCRGEFLPVHEELLVAFPPPASARVPHIQQIAHEPAAAGRLHQRPVDRAAGFRLRDERVAVPLGVKPSQRFDRPLQRRRGDFKHKIAPLRPVIHNLNPRRRRKGHIPITIEFLADQAHGQRPEFVHPRRRAEKIPQRTPHRRRFGPVPRDPEHELAQNPLLRLPVHLRHSHFQRRDCGRTAQLGHARRRPPAGRLDRADRRLRVFARPARILPQTPLEKIAHFPQRGLAFLRQIPLERRNRRPFRKLTVGEMVIQPPTRIGHDPARLVERDRNVAVVTPLVAVVARCLIDQPRIRKRLVLAIEIPVERQIDGGRFKIVLRVDIDPHAPAPRRRRPDAPDAPGALDLGQHLPAVDLPDEPVAVIVRAPVHIATRRFVVNAGPVVARRLAAHFPLRRQQRQPFQIHQAMDQVGVGQRFARCADRQQHQPRPDAQPDEGPWQRHAHGNPPPSLNGNPANLASPRTCQMRPPGSSRISRSPPPSTPSTASIGPLPPPPTSRYNMERRVRCPDLPLIPTRRLRPRPACRRIPP